ncbi:hypothetical protein CMI37_29960 [Candidatus Pacearchaeota archaeon]|nr:hypothetical protein [Candidatus Pacearchaeota archaeon]|tara:strand:+ start:2671 stop:3507 length:837 start_codon:yes stop_codon:yes gene_type:complete
MVGEMNSFFLEKRNSSEVEKLRLGKQLHCFPNRKAQVAIFIIVGIVLVVGIIMAILFFGGVDVQLKEDLNPEQFISKCVRDAVEPSVGAVLGGGGRVGPSFFKMYQDEEYNYLCYNRNYYLPCVNQYPQLKEIVEDEIKQDSKGRVDECFAALKRESEDKGFSFDAGALDYDIELVPKAVLIKVEKRIDIVREGNAETFSEFDTRILSPLYELAGAAREIVNQESQYCNFEYNGFMLFYPEFEIQRIDDEDKIYLLTDKRSGKLFKFAVRSCVLPPGI